MNEAERESLTTKATDTLVDICENDSGRYSGQDKISAAALLWQIAQDTKSEE